MKPNLLLVAYGRDTCFAGHLYTEANTRWTKGGYRRCRACEREASKRRWAA